ncbi:MULTISPECIES: GGDEF domain-containing protein [unclassified Thioalkalivibrio]|uniref:GGDEF domain-containing protein n=1 Tax=unclassified Thioalkalivibrio TaxID=2621013 RepID=UPI00036C09F7|nr:MULTISPECIES: GGDEF domain-containing protein [unclassified Thioalkalivibrio]
MLNWIANGAIVLGAAGLIYAQWNLARLLRELPESRVRTGWLLMFLLIPVFTLGYLGYIPLNWGMYQAIPDLLVPIIFLLGGCFVCSVVRLSYSSVESIRRITRLEHESITDPLTGLCNRRQMDRRLDDEVARARRYGQPLSVIMLDIDHFKAINDRLGHLAGDYILQSIALRLQQNLRRVDLAARFGGEEFVVIAPHTHLDAALQLAEKLRNEIARTPVVLKGHEHVPPCAPDELYVTVSVGTASLDTAPDSRDNADFLIQRADDALYRAKAGGRNRCEPGQERASLAAASDLRANGSA